MAAASATPGVCPAPTVMAQSSRNGDDMTTNLPAELLMQYLAAKGKNRRLILLSSSPGFAVCHECIAKYQGAESQLFLVDEIEAPKKRVGIKKYLCCASACNKSEACKARGEHIYDQ
jgi:hypothetical protein